MAVPSFWAGSTPGISGGAGPTTMTAKPRSLPDVVEPESAIWDGWTEFENEPFDSITPSGWVSTAGGGTRALVSGGVEMNFPEAMAGGTAPWQYDRAFTRTRGIGSSHKFLVSSDYVANTVQNKVAHFWGGVDPAEANNAVMGIQIETADGADPLYPTFGTQGTTIASPTVVVGTTKASDPGSGAYTWTNNGTAFTRATFHTIDTQIMGNTVGASDGWVKVWMDGVLRIHVTGLAWKAGAYTFTEWRWDPTYGGVSAVPAPGGFKERTGDGAGVGVLLYSRAA